jgi:uncharacterized delta-60 repeat protein
MHAFRPVPPFLLPLRSALRSRGGRAGLLAGACVLLASGGALAASADLDPSFGSDGVAFAEPGGSAAAAIARQPDGKLVAAGSAATPSGDAILVARFDASGAPDPTFAGDGTVTTKIGSLDDDSAQVLVQPDGKIVVVGRTEVGDGDLDVVLIRYDSDGSLDAGFGTGGVAVTSLGAGADQAQAGALQSDGKIVVAGRTAPTPGGLSDLFLLRFDPDGTLDGTFGTGGLVTLDFGGRRDQGRAVAVQPDGMILVAGTSFNGPVFLDGAVATLSRIDATGTPDGTFGTAGSVVRSTDVVDLFTAMALQPDGKIVLLGASGPSAIVFRLFRYDASGAPDPGFVGEASPLFTQAVNPGALALQSDGKFLIVGNPTGALFSVARMNDDGSLDESFGMGGDVGVAVGVSGIAVATVAEPGGDIVLAGVASPGPSEPAAMALARLQGSSAACGTDADCGVCERCGGGGSCEIGERSGCTVAAARRAQLVFRESRGNAARLKLLWRGAVPSFDPTVADDVGACLYSAGRRILKAVAPAAGTCGTAACWSGGGAGEFEYRDEEQTPDGIHRLSIEPDRVKLLAKGLELATSAQGVPSPTVHGVFAPPVVAQVHAGNGACVEATFDTQRRTTPRRFSAKND